MITALLIAAATPPASPVSTAVDAERAFAADAQKLGQWTAFRKWGASGGILFVPKAVYALQWLPDRKDPPESVKWQPAQSYQSCDGKVAVNVGPWQRPDGSFGYFTTVWLYEDQLIAGPKWMWVYDAGDTLKKSLKAPKTPLLKKAACGNVPTSPPGEFRYRIPSLPYPDGPAPQKAELQSADRTLLYDYAVEENGARRFAAYLWNGRRYDRVVHQLVAAPPQP